MIRNGTELEEYVKHVYSSLLNMKDEGVVVSRRAVLRGKSGANHEVDVYYEFKRAGIRHRVAIECKHLGRPVEKGDIAEFEGKVRDIGGVKGVVISNSGYQEGAIQYASHWDILLLTTNDLPTLNILLADRLRTVALPDETYIGEPFWTIMEVRDGKVTGSYYGQMNQNDKQPHIPLFFSKQHAEVFFNVLNDKDRWL
jgi:hypothetical protein